MTEPTSCPCTCHKPKHDRLADYLARMDNPEHRRELDDGCTGCGHSLVYCRCNRYCDMGPCCPACSH